MLGKNLVLLLCITSLYASIGGCPREPKLVKIAECLKAQAIIGLSFSPDGEKIAYLAHTKYTHDFPWVLVLLSREGKEIAKFTGMGFAEVQTRLQLSPTGTAVLVDTLPHGKFAELLIDLRKKRTVNLGPKGTTFFQNAWSPDGEKFFNIPIIKRADKWLHGRLLILRVYNVRTSSDVEIARVQAPQRILRVGGCWSTNPNVIYYWLYYRNYAVAVFKIQVNTKTITKVIDLDNVSRLALSPAQRKMSWISKDEKSLWVVKIDGSQKKRLVAPIAGKEIRNFEWSPDERKIAVVLDDPLEPLERYIPKPELWTLDTNTNKLTRVTPKNESTGFANYSWSPDGGSLIFASVDFKEPTSWHIWLYKIE